MESLIDNFIMFRNYSNGHGKIIKEQRFHVDIIYANITINNSQNCEKCATPFLIFEERGAFVTGFHSWFWTESLKEDSNQTKP